MFKFINVAKTLVSVSIAALLMGCGTTATVTRPGAPTIEGRISGSDNTTIYVDTEGGPTPMARDSITDIDHPGNVAATIGAVVTGYGIANIAAGAPDCDRGGAAYCMGVFLPAAIGAPIMTWGIATWVRSVNAAGSKNNKSDSMIAIVPVVSTDKKNEYVGVSASMRF